MTTQGIDFKNAIERNSGPLLDCKRMLCGFKLDKWTLSIRARLNVTFQVKCIRVAD